MAELPEGPGSRPIVSPEIKAEKKRARARKDRTRRLLGKMTLDRRRFNATFLATAQIVAAEHKQLLDRLAET